MSEECENSQNNYPQIKIVSIRMMKPETTGTLLDILVKLPGIRRILLKGQNIPKIVPYGPARGIENNINFNTNVSIAETDVDIRMFVGDIILELEDQSVIEEIKQSCEQFFTSFGFYIQTGIFIKPSPSLVDYAKYGPKVESELVGMVDPKRNNMPVMIGRYNDLQSGGSAEIPVNPVEQRQI